MNYFKSSGVNIPNGTFSVSNAKSPGYTLLITRVITLYYLLYSSKYKVPVFYNDVQTLNCLITGMKNLLTPFYI